MSYLYKYWAYGLFVESEIEFPELFPFEFETTDVAIRLGKTPETLIGDDVVHRVRVSISPNEYLLKLLNIANYYVANGNEIIIEPHPNVDKGSIRLFLLSNALAAILYQRGSIPYHASAIEHNGELALICGESGAGKSTSLSLLIQQGHRAFSDDVCVLHPSEANSKQINAYASYPMIKLWEDSFDLLQIEKQTTETKIRPELPKYARYFHDKFKTDSVEVRHIFVLEKGYQQSEVQMQHLSNVEAFFAVQKHIYRPMQMQAMKLHKANLNMLTNLLINAKVYKITRPVRGNFTKEVLMAIEQALQINE